MEPIAIVGFAFKLPGGVEDESSLWKMLQEARNVMSEYSPTRVNIDTFYDPGKKRNNTLYSKGAHFLSGNLAAFDAPFFMITKDEAASMDPQQRLLLEVSYHALENDPETNSATAIVGTSPTIVAGRLSWFFDFRGPCMHIDTACSSSLTALDLAVQNLRNTRSRMALVAGSNLILSPDVSLAESNMLFLSPDSQCKTFTSSANGYGRGEGVVALILKRVSDAVADGDVIRAVIRNSGSNQDGRTPGIGRPSVDAQQSLITQVYHDASLDLTKTRYFEAHGTGTAVGDPIETKAIGRAFRTSRSSDEPLYIGSIKSNIGHIEAGSGIASVIKAIMILERGTIPPNALFDRLNPEIDADFYHLKVPIESTPWPSTGLRRVSINSFGFGGSNAHVVLDDARHFLQERDLVGHHRTSEYPEGFVNDHGGTVNGHALSEKEGPVIGSQILCLAAKDEAALKRMINVYSNYYDVLLCEGPEQIQQLAFTLATRKSQFPWRSFAFADFTPSNNQWKVKEVEREITRADSSKLGIAFVFTGQGAQYSGMGQQLFIYPSFISTLRTINEIYQDFGAEWDILDEIRNAAHIHDPAYSQPICTALQIALVELLRSWKINPLTVVGHSSGEIAAAYIIGALTLQSACKVAYWRGHLASGLAKSTPIPGAMLSVNLSEIAAHEYLTTYQSDGALTIACINSPSNVTISGPRTDIDLLSTRLAAEGIQVFQVNTGVSYHSPAMKEIAKEYREHLGDLENKTLHPSRQSPIVMVSTVTGHPVSADKLCSAQYWIDNLVSPVRFLDAVQHLAKFKASSKMKLCTPNLRPIYDIIEIGPHSALRRATTESVNSLDSHAVKNVLYHSILNRSRPNLRSTLEIPARLFAKGYPVDIPVVNSSTRAKLQESPLLSDTPAYPFDDSQNYWSESRISRDFRLRGGGPASGILGVRASDWNPLEPRWRKFVSVEEMAWVADHVISGTPLFPAAGMIIMALAAVQEYLDISSSTLQPNGQISGFGIKEASFLAPIIVRSQIELQTHLRPTRRNHEKSAKWCDVHIYTYTQIEDNKTWRWAECFKASIQTQYSPAATEVDGQLEARLTANKARSDFDLAKTKCTKPVSKESFYTRHTAHGLNYGPRFRLVDDIHWDGDRISTASVHESAQDCPTGAFIHPAALDAAFQTCMTAVWSQATAQNAPTLVPNRLFDTFVSAQGWEQRSSTKLQIMTSSEAKSTTKGATCRVLILDVNGKVLCDVSKLEISPVAGDTHGNVRNDKKIIYGIKWRPLISQMTTKQLESIFQAAGAAHLNQNAGIEAAMTEFYLNLESMLINTIDTTLAKVSVEDIAMMPEHLQYYTSWMKLQLQCYRARTIKDNESLELVDLEVDCNHLVTLKPSWELFVTIARNLDSILRGTADPLEYMFSTRQAETFYADICANMYPSVEPFFTLTAHENPKQQILEVGAGTGSMTTNIMETFRKFEIDTGCPAFAQYTYTDISSAFFESARTNFNDFVRDGKMLFQTFDLDQPAMVQGFQRHTYDVIIAGSVIHATSNIKTTLQNLHQLLKPSGRLVLLEITAPEKIVGSFAFGTLPGWWRGQETNSASSPAVDEDAWDSLLKDSGFTGNDVVIRDWEDVRVHDFSFILSTATEPSQVSHMIEKGRIVFVTADSAQQHALVDEFMRKFDDRGAYKHSIISLPHISTNYIQNEDVVVFLEDTEGSILDTADDQMFEQVKLVLFSSKKLLWVCTAQIEDSSYTSKSLSTGLLRSLRTEEVGKQIVTLNFEDSNVFSSMESKVAHIGKVFQASFDQQSPELEYVVRKDTLCVPRLSYRQTVDRSVRDAIIPSLRQEPWASEDHIKLSVGTPGNLESLQFTEDSDSGLELSPHDIEVEAKAWGLSFRDVFMALGRLNEADGFGFECAGIVRRVGIKCIGFCPGDRVCMTARGSMRQYPRCNQMEVVHLPLDLTFEDAASLIGPALTAVYSLIEVGRLRRGEKVLIHSAAGATGQLAIMLAQSLGAEIYCTVGSDRKKQHLIEQFSIPGERILYSRDTSFVAGIKRLTDGYGVDVLLNSLSGDSLVGGWDCMAPYGRFIEIGKTDIMANERLPMGGFKRNVTFTAIDFYHTTEFRKDITKSMLAKAMLLVSTGTLTAPKPIHVYPASKVEDAFRFLQSGQHIGRIVIVPQVTDIVPKYICRKPSWRFSGTASYVIVGGFGGLGRAILPWMVDNGAKHLVVLSRAGPTSIAAKEVAAQLHVRGVQVYAPQCDASSQKDLRAVLDEVRLTMPPIRGCINAAMLLQDSLFLNMTQAQWNGTVDSKLRTSMNLSELLPEELDFFILFSSLSGVYGTPGQSNYAAGCASQDALARQRIQKGLRAASIDIGWMRTIGVVAESELYQRVREREADMQTIEEDEFLSLLAIYCDPNRQVTDPDESQVLLGPVTPADIRAQGEEPPPILQRPLFIGFDGTRQFDKTLVSAQSNQLTPSMLFTDARTAEERKDIVLESLIGKISRALAVASADIDTSKPMFEYGVDSLVGLELRNWMVKEFGSEVAVFDIMSGISIAEIGALVVERSSLKLVKSGYD